MTSNDILAQLGVYFQPGFLPPLECGRLIDLIDARDSHPGAVYDPEEGGRVDGTQRQVSEVSGLGDEIDWLTRRFDEVRPRISGHFDEDLSRVDQATLLVYNPGDFFLPHSDNGTREGNASRQEAASRRVTGIVYLNSEADRSASGGYEGGRLTLYGLMKFAGGENHGFQVQGATGLLVAFQADQRHGVTELILGRRYCALTWFR